LDFPHYNSILEQGLTVLGELETRTHIPSRELVVSGCSRPGFVNWFSMPRYWPLFQIGSHNAVPEHHPLVLERSSPSSHSTALASQVAWITGESHISRPGESHISRPKERATSPGLRREPHLPAWREPHLPARREPHLPARREPHLPT
jgi:hypothetical protein